MSEFTMTACDHGASVWLIEVGGLTILFDTWLVDPYHALGEWFFEASRTTPPKIPLHALPSLDYIFISSVEQDHCNPRSLAQLDKSVPIITVRGAVRRLRRWGFRDVSALDPGVSVALPGTEVTALALRGYARNQPYVLRTASGEAICIAQHGIEFDWLRRNLPTLRQRGWLCAPLLCLCVPAYTTLLRLRGIPRHLMPDNGINMPYPEELADVVELLRAQNVLFTHSTPERETGWASRNLIHFPNGNHSVDHCQSVLSATCRESHIMGIVTPGIPYPLEPARAVNA